MSEKSQEKSDVARREEEILNFWNENKIFDKTEEKDSPKGEFVFYDGPPFATGLPHYGHILAGTIKDVIPRYKTMQGYKVRRRWGWDCHGLPLENEIEKKLGLKSKKDIEDIGVDVFNKSAKESVLRYADDWRRIVPRMGRFVHMNDDYKTMDANYTESVWWVFRRLYDKGLITEGFKPMHLCPRCGTTLSNFEVAQGYKDIKDFSVIIKFELEEEKGTYLLAWTTTPWTLPGNMAVAINKNETYVKISLNNEFYILAKNRLETIKEEYNIEEEFSGGKLIGKKYNPPFNYFKEKEIDNKENAWKVYHADFVTMEDGTGVVHIAPAFGSDDMDLAKHENLPIVHHVGTDGKFTKEVKDFVTFSVKPKDDHQSTDIEIIKYLAHNGLLFAKEKIEHSYPHCWRCQTPLLNYAASSWFVEVPKIKNKLISENKKVNWIPNDIRDGRFGKWLEGARDWAISRSRYWGAPIPVWKCEEINDVITIGSIDELKKYVKTSGNTYYTMRHGESKKNVIEIVTNDLNAPYNLTEKGKKEVRNAVRSGLPGSIDIIIASPVVRTKEAALLAAEELGLDESAIIFDERIRETEHGVFEGKRLDEFFAEYPSDITRFDRAPEGGENWSQIRKRMGGFLYDLENKHQGKRILIVSHGDPLALLHTVTQGKSREEATGSWNENYPEKGKVRKLNFKPLPHNNDYELDLHRPYIDDVVLKKDGKEFKRVPDVFDCWFESGSMPYGQFHYPFENKDQFEPKSGLFKKNKGFPADFVAEGLDQTRGWFYSLIVLGVALFDKAPYKNVIVNGMVLAEDGKKMSKSLNNYPDPMGVVDKYGADALRYYMLSSPAVRGEDLNFSEKGVQEVMRKNVGRLSNVLTFYNLYKNECEHVCAFHSNNILDEWISSRLNETISTTTKGMEQYELERAIRPIGEFIDDLSTWYLRRSRDRFKSENIADKKEALETTRYVLREISKLIAPVMPFFADYLYKQVCGDTEKESVHLESWPKRGDINEDLLATMKIGRSYINIGLQLRNKKGIKVRQPLASFWIKHDSAEPKYWSSVKILVADELNVKEVRLSKNKIQNDQMCDFDWELTPKLIKEGNYRELVRRVQELRKKEKLNPQDLVVLKVFTDNSGKNLIKKWQSDFKNITGLKEIIFEEFEDVDKVEIGESAFYLKIIK